MGGAINYMHLHVGMKEGRRPSTTHTCPQAHATHQLLQKHTNTYTPQQLLQKHTNTYAPQSSISAQCDILTPNADNTGTSPTHTTSAHLHTQLKNRTHPHRMHVSIRWPLLSHLYGRDAQGPNICQAVISYLLNHLGGHPERSTDDSVTLRHCVLERCVCKKSSL